MQKAAIMFTTLLARIAVAAAHTASVLASAAIQHSTHIPHKTPLRTMNIRERVRYNKALTEQTAHEPLNLTEPIGVAVGDDAAATAVPTAPYVLAVPTNVNTIELLAVRPTHPQTGVHSLPLSEMTVNDLFTAVVDNDHEMTVTDDSSGATWVIMHGATLTTRSDP